MLINLLLNKKCFMITCIVLVGELQSQIQDLQEANESAVEEISAAENKIKQLAGDNETLRATQASNMRDLEEDNRHLKHEVFR